MSQRSLPHRRGRKHARFRLLWQWALLVVGLLVLSGIGLGLAFAGSPQTLPEGARVAGVEVAGLSPDAARSKLERRSRELETVPVVFVAGERRFSVKPTSLYVETDWSAAVDSARREGQGFGPFRGLKRLGVRVFGADIVPRTRVSQAALDYEIQRVRRVVDRPRAEPSLRLKGFKAEIVPGRTGRVLDPEATADVMVRALAGFSRMPVPLPVRIDRPRLTEQDLAPAQARARTILSAPVGLALGKGGWRIHRWRLARMLELPEGGSQALRIGGPEATRFFKRVSEVVERPARDAAFSIGAGNRVRVVSSAPGRSLDAPATARALVAAGLSPTRVARVKVTQSAPERTTAEARAMRITGLVGAYETIYGGEANRLHNVRLVANLIDGKVIAPGAQFSFNGATGERDEEKGFLEAPVIINGELKTGLGGGVCQVSTTVFNAAYEAGLSIEDRTNHALYISHYPLGRDATVNYPDTDLRFLNDTGHWLLLRTFVGSSSLTVALYGTPQHRRIVSETQPLEVTGAPPVKRVPDPGLFVGETALEESGEPSRATSVRRRVYRASGDLLYDHTWYSSYRAEPRVIRYGTKPRPKPEKKEPKEPKVPAPSPPPAASPPPNAQRP